MAFLPISIDEYFKLHMKSNPGQNPRQFLERLCSCVREGIQGARCDCGAPIWVIGSAAAQYACFTCITGEAYPSEDYEIDEVLHAARRFRHRK